MRKGQDKKEIMPNFLKDLNTENFRAADSGQQRKERSRTGRRRKGAESGRGYMRAAV